MARAPAVQGSRSRALAVAPREPSPAETLDSGVPRGPGCGGGGICTVGACLGGGGKGRQPNRRGLHPGSLVQPRAGYQIDPNCPVPECGRGARRDPVKWWSGTTDVESRARASNAEVSKTMSCAATAWLGTMNLLLSSLEAYVQPIHTSTVRRRRRELAAMAAPRHEVTAHPLDHGRDPCLCWPTMLQLLLPSRRAWPCSISCRTTYVPVGCYAEVCLASASCWLYVVCALAFEALKVMNDVFWLLLLDQRFGAKCLPHPPASYR
jgi:hypothetical protein